MALIPWQMIVALGINSDGRKTVLGLREGATENAAVVSELLGDLASRGLDFSVPRLYVLDGGKALAAGVRRHAGEAAMIQRCQVHKRRNVIDHLPEEHKPAIKKKLQNAYAMTEYADAKRALERFASRTDGDGVPQRETLARPETTSSAGSAPACWWPNASSEKCKATARSQCC
jgi:putative transposase